MISSISRVVEVVERVLGAALGNDGTWEDDMRSQGDEPASSCTLAVFERYGKCLRGPSKGLRKALCRSDQVGRSNECRRLH